MARISSLSITGAALEQARGFGIEFLFEGSTSMNQTSQPALSGGRSARETRGRRSIQPIPTAMLPSSRRGP
eukprot:9564868-Lingulodinium_polyedra.AAC.1